MPSRLIKNSSKWQE
uniref:Uncharacterized protein n=1 Tax=Rhizophora mucronata TaxID=61149 RepID=A0A2P2NZ89_RHIMU